VSKSGIGRSGDKAIERCSKDEFGKEERKELKHVSLQGCYMSVMEKCHVYLRHFVKGVRSQNIITILALDRR
jgi:hypothetical protein